MVQEDDVPYSLVSYFNGVESERCFSGHKCPHFSKLRHDCGYMICFEKKTVDVGTCNLSPHSILCPQKEVK